MATINSNTQLALINASNPGTINLPSASLGQFLTFKDALGTFGTNNIRLVCAGADTFEDGASSKVLKEVRGNIQIVGSGTKWYVLSGTQVNTLNVSSITSIGVSSFSISTSALYLSSLSLIDNNKSTNTLYTSSFLNYNNYIIAGTRIGYNNIVMPISYASYSVNYPTKISGLSLWLDGADSTSITTGSTFTWRDKSVNGYNAIQSTLANQPTYNSGTGGLSFNVASSTFLDSAYTAVPSLETVFAVINPTSITGAKSFDIVSTNVSNGRQFFIYATLVSTAPAGGAISCSGPAITVSQTILVEMTYAGTAASVLEYYNGAVQVDTATGTTAFSGIGTTRIGGGTSGITYFQGTMYEIICYNSVLTTQQRQQVEGYLAWKWNLVSSLPANHPYAYIPPPV